MSEELKIYVNFEAPATLAEFLDKYFDYGYNINNVRGIETYYDKECTTIQCVSGKYRSFDDLMLLAKTYYPDTTPADLMRELLLLEKAGRHDSFGDGTCPKLTLLMGNCADINRIRVCYFYEKNSYEFTRTIDKLNSQYSWTELLSMIGINSQEDLDSFRENKGLLIKKEELV